MRLLFAARRWAPDSTTPDAIQAARAWSLFRNIGESLLVAGWIRDRAGLPPEARAVDLCGLRGARPAWVWRSAVSRAHQDLPDARLVTTDPLSPRGGRPAALWIPAVGEHTTTWRDAAWWARAATFTRVIVPDLAAGRAAAARGIPADRLRVIPPLLPRVRGGEPAKVRRLLVLGRLAPDRGAHLAIDAVARLSPAEKQGVRLTVAGPVADAAYVRHLRHLARGQPVDLREGYLEAGDALGATDLVLIPHLSARGPSRVLVEALAVGLPLFATAEAADGLGSIGPILAADAAVWRDALRRWLASPGPRPPPAGEDPARLWHDVLQGLPDVR